MKKKFKKIPISDFISDKKLKKIMGIIEKGDDVETAYDRIEILLSDMDLKVIGLGTNRIIFESTKKKYDEIVFKIAGDRHGIEANYREFYNGDLDDSLTFSYSISDNGVFLVQEKVKVFNSKRMEKKKKDVRSMLKHLAKKILLVDCKLQNFRNFGERDNGDIVLLDHGDTVPLIKYQNDNDIVNIGEESSVSLRCKRLVDITSGKPKPCNGHLEYSKNFDSFVCSKCKHIQSINDAYRDIWNNDNGSYNANKELRNSLDFDADEWMSKVKNYAANIMGSVNKNNEKEGVDQEMKTKVINGNECKQLKGFWIPTLYFNSPVWSSVITAIKMGNMNPKEFLESRDLIPDEYKVKLADHSAKDESDWTECAQVAAKMIIDTYNQSNEPMVKVYYKTIDRAMAVNKYIYSIDNIAKERAIWKNLMNSNLFSKVIYTKDCFILYGSVKEEEVDEPYTHNHYNATDYDSGIIDVETTDTVEVDNAKDTETVELVVNGHKCTAYGKYYVPNELIEEYNNDDDYDEPFDTLSNSEIKKLLKLNGYSPKLYRNENSEDAAIKPSVDTDVKTDSIDQNTMEELVDRIISENDINESDDPSNYEYDIVIDEFKSIFDERLSKDSDVDDELIEQLGSNRYYVVRESFDKIINVFKDFNDVYDGLFERILSTDDGSAYDIKKCISFMDKYLGIKSLYNIDEIQINFATELVEFCRIVTDEAAEEETDDEVNEILGDIDDEIDDDVYGNEDEDDDEDKDLYEYEEDISKTKFEKFIDQFNKEDIIEFSPEKNMAIIAETSDSEKVIKDTIEYYAEDSVIKCDNEKYIIYGTNDAVAEISNNHNNTFTVSYHGCTHDCSDCEYNCDIDSFTETEESNIGFVDDDTSVFDDDTSVDQSSTSFSKECNDHIDHVNLEKATAQLAQNNTMLSEKINDLSKDLASTNKFIEYISHNVDKLTEDFNKLTDKEDTNDKLVLPVEEVASMKMAAINLDELDDIRFVIDVNGALVAFDLKKLITDYSSKNTELDPTKLHSITSVDII